MGLSFFGRLVRESMINYISALAKRKRVPAPGEAKLCVVSKYARNSPQRFHLRGAGPMEKDSRMNLNTISSLSFIKYILNDSGKEIGCWTKSLTKAYLKTAFLLQLSFPEPRYNLQILTVIYLKK